MHLRTADRSHMFPDSSIAKGETRKSDLCPFYILCEGILFRQLLYIESERVQTPILHPGHPFTTFKSFREMQPPLRPPKSIGGVTSGGIFFSEGREGGKETP
ncbi:hypothetical protein Trydic_g5682 [Trypoxylus dichotomus]